MKLLKELQQLVETKDSMIADRDEWMDAVKKAYPHLAAKIVFKGRVEDGKHLFFAEVPGEDRAYGVYSMDDEEGEVLGEAKKRKKKTTVIAPFGYGYVMTPSTGSGEGEVSEGVFSKKPKTAFEVLDHIAKERHGEFGFDTLKMAEAEEYVDFKLADKYAQEMGLPKDAFWSNHIDDMKMLINKHPDILKGQAAEMFKSIK